MSMLISSLLAIDDSQTF